MKRKTALILIFLLVLTGCVKRPPEGKAETSAVSTEEKTAYKHKQKKTVKKDGSSIIEEYDSEDKCLKATFYDENGAVEHTFTYTYDEMGRRICTLSEKADGTTRYDTNVYDDAGNLVKQYRGETEDTLILICDRQYEDGLLKKEINNNDDGTLWHEYIFEYENGLLARKTYVLPSGYIYRSWDYVYDESGKLARMIDTYHEHHTINTYDDQERVIREENYFKDELSSTTVNSYGDSGITETVMVDSKGVEKRHIRYEYENGRIVRNINVSPDGYEVVSVFREYDEKGNLLHRVDLRGYEFTAEYNAYGDPIVEHDVCADSLRNAGTFDDWIYYEYVY